jgi:hypothetical protein
MAEKTIGALAADEPQGGSVRNENDRFQSGLFHSFIFHGVACLKALQEAGTLSLHLFLQERRPGFV